MLILLFSFPFASLVLSVSHCDISCVLNELLVKLEEPTSVTGFDQAGTPG